MGSERTVTISEERFVELISAEREAALHVDPRLYADAAKWREAERIYLQHANTQFWNDLESTRGRTEYYAWIDQVLLVELDRLRNKLSAAGLECS